MSASTRTFDETDPRARLLALSATALSDSELLSIVLDGGAAVDRLVAEIGGPAALARSSITKLVEVAGPSGASRIAAAFELAHRSDEPEARRPLTSTSAIAATARYFLHQASRESLVVLVADHRNQFCKAEILATGSIESLALPVREILSAVLAENGSAFAIAHTHPSRNPVPSEADRQATRTFATAAAAVGLRFLGHVVIGGDRWASAT